MLTHKQKKLLDFIRSYIAENDGIPPLFEEMKRAVGLKSKSGVHRLLSALEERGHIRRLPKCARAIEIVGDPHFIEEERQPTDADEIAVIVRLMTKSAVKEGKVTKVDSIYLEALAEMCGVAA